MSDTPAFLADFGSLGEQPLDRAIADRMTTADHLKTRDALLMVTAPLCAAQGCFALPCAAFCRWYSWKASRSLLIAVAFCSGVRTIWRESTTDIVPVGSRRKSSIVRPNRDCTSSTAFDRSGPICAGLFTPSAEIE